MTIDAQLVQKVRQLTGAGIMDIKKALEEAGGDEAKTLDLLRKRGEKIAAKKQDRTANEGIIDAYVHANGKVASLVMLACETDFVAKNEDFKELAHNIAMQVSAMNPQYLSPEKIPAEVIAKEKEIILAGLEQENKPADIKEKIVAGRLEKFYQEVCLLNQKFFKDDEKTIQDLITEKTAKLGEKIEIKKIARLSFN